MLQVFFFRTIKLLSRFIPIYLIFQSVIINRFFILDTEKEQPFYLLANANNNEMMNRYRLMEQNES